ncbi:MAG: sensor histidine kinase [Planctomycetota bacterium]
MLSDWPIRYKLLLGTAILCLIIATLAFSSLRGVYAYREVVRGISQRARELEPASELTVRVRTLKSTLPEASSQPAFGESPSGTGFMRANFGMSLEAVRAALREYQQALDAGDLDAPYIGDKQRERKTVQEIKHTLNNIEQIYNENDWILQPLEMSSLNDEFQTLTDLTNELPKFLQNKMLAFRDRVRIQYRTWIILTWITSVLAAVALCVLVRLFYVWVFQPMRILINGSRRVAAGDFGHRIRLRTTDEVAELATAMNAMTNRFQQIRDDLDAQVRERTREVVRSEQLASVGFLAAGVAHEINNPMASIAWSAESLESRLFDILNGADTSQQGQNQELDVLRDYLRRIQDEAFRCKGITEKLLDFSRLEDIQRQDTDLRELIQVVLDMVKHLRKHHHKTITFRCNQHVVVPVNPQEIKQVVLNLITNALDSLEEQGTVTVELRREEPNALLTVTDNGIGMTQDVSRHLFEPFFTRRRDGKGTGLGLSITYRIVTDHGGTIQATSDGPHQGSKFQVTLPLSHYEKNHKRQHAAA